MNSAGDAANYLNSIYIDEESSVIINEPARLLREWLTASEKAGGLLKSGVDEDDVVGLYNSDILLYDFEEDSFNGYWRGRRYGLGETAGLRRAADSISEVRDVRVEIDPFNDILARIPDDNYLDRLDDFSLE